MFTIRPFDASDADYAIFAAIDTAYYPYPLGEETLRHFDATRSPDLLFHRDMIERDGQVIAFGEYGHLQWAYHPDKYNFYLVVHPNHEHPDIRPLYFEHVLRALADRAPLALTAGSLEHKEAHTRFLLDNGFKETMRMQLSELDVSAFDPAKFAHVPEKMRALNIRIVTLTELKTIDPNWKQALYDLEYAIVEDVPATEADFKMSPEEFESMMLDNPNTLEDGWFIALDGDRYVGTSRVWRNPASARQLDGSLTGVIRPYRRKGIATALKLRLIAFARQYGAAIILTSNEANNPMYALNLALGFQPRPAWINYEKPLRAAEPAT
ncbi:MAG: GNAT family N-acetyltransferase [Anaerolineae bacterium]|nr:GNAT family N-acetyltransferase [Anaerolineae bacterium]